MSQSSQSEAIRPSPSPAGDGAPEVSRIHSQLAALAEAGECRPLLEYLRVLLNANAVALFPSQPSAESGSCVVTTRGILASSLADLTASLGGAGTAAFTQPAPALGANGCTFGVPVCREGRLIYWLLVQLVLPSPSDLRTYGVILQTVAGFILYREQSKSTDRLRRVLEKTSAFLDVFKQAGAEPDSAKAERIAVDALRDYVGCARVVFGTRQRTGFRIRSISGISKIDAKSTSNLPYEAAMQETLGTGTRVDLASGSPGGMKSVALEILQQRTGAAHLSSLPLAASSGGWLGAVLLEWNDSPSDEARLLLDAAAPYLPALFDLMERSRLPRWLSSGNNFWRRAGRNRRAAIGVGLAAAACVLAFPVHYPVRADCRLAPTVKRVIAAPFTGELRESLVRPGDRVTVGQKLAEMDNRDLKLHEAELAA